MKKALIVTHFGGFLTQFDREGVKYLKSLGYEVHYASNFETPVYLGHLDDIKTLGLITHHIPFISLPLAGNQSVPYKQLKKLMTEERFDLVHCHTPTAGILARLAAHATKTAPVVYTAHGFHFYKGCPLKNYIYYFPEKFCSRYTDLLITINSEDYEFAKKHLNAKKTVMYHGMGINKHDIPQSEADAVREELGVDEKTVFILSVGEVRLNKNHIAVVRALSLMKNKNAVYFVAGNGDCEDIIMQEAEKLGVGDRVRLLGYRTDILQLDKACDIFTMPSFREGLPVSLEEAMSQKKAAVCFDIRGVRDLITNGEGGFLVKKNDIKAFAEKLDILAEDKELREKMGELNYRIIDGFTTEVVKPEIAKAYDGVLK